MRLCGSRAGSSLHAGRSPPAYPRIRHCYPRAGARVKAVHAAVGFATIGLAAGAMLIGAWCWWRVRATPWFWRVLRASQAAVVLSVLLGGLDRLLGNKVSGLH